MAHRYDERDNHSRFGKNRAQTRLTRQVNTSGTGGGKFKRQHLKVTEPAKLLEFLFSKLSNQSASSVKNLLKHRCIVLNDSEIVTQFDRELIPGDDVSIISAAESRYGLFHPKLRILFEDDYLIIVEKGSGLHSVDTTHGGCENACYILDNYVRQRDPHKRVYIVHRLDRDTSGVLIFAKTREAQSKLIEDWNDRVLERTYIAVIEGTLPEDKGIIDSYLYEDEHRVVHSTDDPEKGLRAITHYEVIEQGNGYSRVKLDLETGRTNQIRVHLKSLGHPIIGDEKYGSTVNPAGRLALHALNIRFHHPISQQVMAFSVPEPVCFASVIHGKGDEGLSP